MATEQERARLRVMVDEPTSTTYDDAALDAFILDAGGSLNIAAASIWNEKAAKYASLVDVKEGSSSRSMGDLYRQALDMASGFQKAADDTKARTKRAGTRAIERA